MRRNIIAALVLLLWEAGLAASATAGAAPLSADLSAKVATALATIK